MNRSKRSYFLKYSDLLIPAIEDDSVSDASLFIMFSLLFTFLPIY